MLEEIVEPGNAREKPSLIFFLAMLFVSLAVLINIALPNLAGAALTFAFAPAIPLILSMLIKEESEETKRLELLEQKKAWQYHLPLLKVFALFFAGAFVAYLLWYSFLPDTLATTVFGSQQQEISRLGVEFVKTTRSEVVNQDGQSYVRIYEVSGRAIKPGLAWKLFVHNAVVLLFMFFFSFIYGVGAIYLLLWNASVIGIFVGEQFKQFGFNEFLSVLIRILPHGMLEVGAYFMAAIAGGVLSVALMHKHHTRPQFKLIAVDIALLLFNSLAALALAAVLESL